MNCKYCGTQIDTSTDCGCGCDGEMVAKLQAQVAALTEVVYDAYGLGMGDGIEMANHPLGLGGKTKPEVMAALIQENKYA